MLTHRTCLQVLAIGTGLQERSNLRWWQPVTGSQSVTGQPSEVPWAAWAFSLELKEGEVHAKEADSAAKLLFSDANQGPSRYRCL